VKRLDRVFYVPDPGLYGAMEVNKVRSDGMVVCRLDLDREGVFEYEIFAMDELEAVVRERAAA
jgi:uncharacterized protein YodC (DUF2158 family)